MLDAWQEAFRNVVVHSFVQGEQGAGQAPPPEGRAESKAQEKGRGRGTRRSAARPASNVQPIPEGPGVPEQRMTRAQARAALEAAKKASALPAQPDPPPQDEEDLIMLQVCFLFHDGVC